LAPGPLGSVAGDPDRYRRGWLLYSPSSVPRPGAEAARVLGSWALGLSHSSKYMPRHAL
jgi:hypothetical protein